MITYVKPGFEYVGESKVHMLRFGLLAIWLVVDLSSCLSPPPNNYYGFTIFTFTLNHLSSPTASASPLYLEIGVCKFFITNSLFQKERVTQAGEVLLSVAGVSFLAICSVGEVMRQVVLFPQINK